MPGDEKLIKKHKFFILPAVILLFFMAFAGCSKQDDEQAVEEKGRIEKMTDEAADQAVKKIRTPIEKARDTGNLGDQRMEEMDRVLQKQ